MIIYHNETACTVCSDKTVLSNYNSCQECPDDCSTCTIDGRCTSCESGYILSSNGRCLHCVEGCDKCIINDDQRTTSCLSCNYGYIYEDNGTCTNCDLDYVGGNGCEKCGYNNNSNKYECYECRRNNNIYSYNYVLILNDTICKSSNEINLSKECIEAINVGDPENPIYSCERCSPYTAKIKSISNGISDCYYRTDNNLSYCLEGELDEDNILNCTACVEHALLFNGICECEFDSFSKNELFCYLCDDRYQGNPGCNNTEGCEYRLNVDQLNCNKCKNGYFLYTLGQCLSCSQEIEFCSECETDLNEILYCQKCIEDFIYNPEEKRCKKKYEENIEISSGCINFHNESKTDEECEVCKPFYFKTKDNKCMYCNQNDYGGAYCSKCEYKIDENGNETNETICTKCNGVLGSDGKCYDCKIDLFDECESCRYDDGQGNLVCTLCRPGYYLDNNGNCINYLNNIMRIDNCREHSLSIGNVFFNHIFYNKYDEYIEYDKFLYHYKYYYSFSDLKYINDRFIDFINDNVKQENINPQIDPRCVYCKEGYFVNSQGLCVPLTLNDCTFISMIDNSELYYKCENLCFENEFPFTLLDLSEISNSSEYYSVSEAMGLYKNKFIIQRINLQFVLLCIDNSDTNSQNLQHCAKALLREQEPYLCQSCSQGYTLDNQTNTCNRIEELPKIPNCYEYENIGDEDNPNYSCRACYNYFYMDYLLVREGDIGFCVEKYNEGLENCLEADANTTFIRTKYNCKSCIINHLPYNSSFFGRTICHNIYEDIIRNNSLYIEPFPDTDYVNTSDGICPERKFTPDDELCFNCDDDDVGMPGCRGSCSFSRERNDLILCEGECKDEYIESSKGVCELCDSINEGCNKCHYDENYPPNYFGIKRKRRFICDECEADYFKEDETCKHCSYYIPYCEKCSTLNDNLVCNKCESGFYLIGNECEYCYGMNKVIIGDNNCIECDDTLNGGIEGCKYCEVNSNGVAICSLCFEDYILLSNNKRCLERSQNSELTDFYRCDEVTLYNNNEYHCSRCKDEYLTLFQNNCIYIPEFDYYFYSYDQKMYKYNYNYHNSINEYYATITNNNDIYYLYYYLYYDYLYHYVEYCQEAINLGTQNNPFYSCIKCYDLFEYSKKSENNFILITEEKTNFSFCTYKYSDSILEGCTKASMTFNGHDLDYSCTECEPDYSLVHNDEDDLNYCHSTFSELKTRCMVKHCKECKKDKNYYCETCLSSDYKLITLTGSCMKRIEVEPTITWKDIFRLSLNSKKIINGRIIYGPTLWLRGITRSRINSRHAFLIYLTFKIRQSNRLIRNLEIEDYAKLETICEISKEVEVYEDDINYADYECVSENIDNLQFIELVKIEEPDHISNLENLASQKNLSDIQDYPTFTEKDLLKTVLFNMNAKEITSNYHYYNFTFDGYTHKKLEKEEIEFKLEMNNYEDLQSKCKFIIGEQKKAKLNCQLNAENHTEENTFSFKTFNVDTGEKNIELADLYKVKLKTVKNANNDMTKGKYSNTNKKSKRVIIIISVIAGIIALGAIISLVYIFFIRKKAVNPTTNEINPSSLADINNITKYSQTSENINN